MIEIQPVIDPRFLLSHHMIKYKVLVFDELLRNEDKPKNRHPYHGYKSSSMA
jgi:hypothetical protein